MRRTSCLFLAAAMVLLAAAGVMAAEKKPMTAIDLWSMKRISSLALSPDGSIAAFVVTSYDIDKNSGQGDIWLAATDGSWCRRFTTGESTESSPAWSPDGKMIAFIARRDEDRPQLYVIGTGGGEAAAITDMPLGASSPKWLPGTRKIVFVSKIIPGYEGKPDSMKAEIKRREESKVTARVTEDRFYRYWDHWLTDGYVSHLFTVDIDTRETVDLMPGWDRLCDADGIDYDVSPGGDEIAFTAFREGSPYDELESDVFQLDPSKPGKVRNITADNPADDFSPVYTRDGKYILYGRQKIRDFYGDRVRLVRFNRRTEEKKLLTEGFDRSPSGWSTDASGSRIYFTAEDRAMTSIFTVNVKGGEVREVFRGGTNTSVYPIESGHLVFLHQSNSEPVSVCRIGSGGRGMLRLTRINDDILSRIEMGRMDDVWFTGAEGDRVQMFMLYPPGFDPSKKWPLLILVHGGPHGTFGDIFHYRWNAQLFAAPGYVTAMVNFHGSSSFGQEFTDAITGENGRKPFLDVMSAADTILTMGFIDKNRMAVAGGSYGGYLASWIGTQTARFACLIDHDGVFDLCAQFGSDITSGRARAYGGTPWDGLEDVIRWSPAHNMRDYVTPTLIIHGERDFRVPVGIGLEAYGMLKAKGVPARLVYFPDENHWVLSPQNSIYWYGEFHGWLDRWIGAGPEDDLR